jgi:hypothetical protein
MDMGTNMIKRFKRFKFFRHVEQGCCIPRWYGIAWYDKQKMYAICTPIVTNLIIAVAYCVYWRIKSWRPFCLNVEVHHRLYCAEGELRNCKRELNKCKRELQSN